MLCRRAAERHAGLAREGNFLDLLMADQEVSTHLSVDEIKSLFDLGYHTKHVETIFRRLFG